MKKSLIAHKSITFKVWAILSLAAVSLFVVLGASFVFTDRLNQANQSSELGLLLSVQITDQLRIYNEFTSSGEASLISRLNEIKLSVDEVFGELEANRFSPALQKSLEKGREIIEHHWGHVDDATVVVLDLGTLQKRLGELHAAIEKLAMGKISEIALLETTLMMTSGESLSGAKREFRNSLQELAGLSSSSMLNIIDLLASSRKELFLQRNENFNQKLRLAQQSCEGLALATRDPSDWELWMSISDQSEEVGSIHEKLFEKWILREELSGHLNETTSQILELSTAIVEIADEQKKRVATRISGYLTVLALGLVAVLLFGGKLLLRGIIQPVSRLKKTAQSLGEGNLSSRISVSNAGELGVLADAFNTMADRLEATLSELERDIASRKLTEKKLTFTQTAIDRSSDATFFVNKLGNFTYVNHAACTNLGYSKEELLGMGVSDVNPNMNREEWSKKWDTYVAKGSLRVESSHRRKDGQVFPVELSINNISFGEENFNCVFARDISQRKMIEEELRQAQKMEAIGTLAGGIAHDFNNILGAILGYTELTLTDGSLADEAKDNLGEVLFAAKRAKELVKQILMFSRKDSAGKKPVFLHLIVDEACRLLSQTIPKTVKINLNADSATGAVMADATQIHQVIMNLCSNAYQSMKDSGGSINVTLKQTRVSQAEAGRYPDLTEGDYALLTIQDTGSGISTSDLVRIFDPFFTTKEVGQGTGMGLAVVHGIIKSHSGAIGVESEIGRGTTFRLYLPITRAEPDEPSAKENHFERGAGRILIVDDEETLATLLKKILESFNYRVSAFTSPDRALDALKASPDAYDLLITDQTMPGMTGEYLVKEALSVRSDLPAIICTGYSDVLDEAKAKEAGAKALLMKPLERSALSSVIKDVLERKA